MSKFAKELPGFNNFDSDDFSAIIDSSFTIMFGILGDDYYRNGEINIILKNIQFSRARVLLIFGKAFHELAVNFRRSYSKLKFTDYEKALFYPFVLCSCNEFLVKDKTCLFQLKEKYTRALIYEFDLNKRNDSFYRDLNDVRLKKFSKMILNN